MSWSDICGCTRQKEFFERAVYSGRIAHAYLFFGPSGGGKSTFALELAKLLNCLNPTPNGSCGQCSNCRLINNLSHPDVSLLSPSADSIKIGEIREFVKWLNLKFVAGKMKVGIIKEAEKMTEEAANCLLKTLEEPPRNSVIILVTSRLSSLLSTIVSRCQLIEFSPLSPLEISNYLVEKKGWKEEEAQKVAARCGGNLEKIEEMQKNKDSLEDKLWELWHRLKSESYPLSLGSWLYNNKEQLSLVMDFLEQYLRDLWIWKVTDGNCEELLFFDKEKVEKEAQEQEAETFNKLIFLVDNLVFDLSTNLNWDIVLLRFLLLWRGEWNYASSSRN